MGSRVVDRGFRSRVQEYVVFAGFARVLPQLRTDVVPVEYQLLLRVWILGFGRRLQVEDLVQG